MAELQDRLNAARLQSRLDAARSVPLDQTMDRTTGAPAFVRSQVGGSRKPEDRLANIQRFYPDAQPYGDDNFVYTDPRTGRPTLYNEENPKIGPVPIPTLGDIASIGGELSEVAGGVVGGALAIPPSIATLNPIPIAAGVGLGAAGGRELYDLSGELLNDRIDTRSGMERLTDAGVTATVNAAGQRIGDALPGMVKGAIQYGKNALAGRSAAGVADDFAQAGVEATADAVSGSRPIQGITNALGDLPTSSNIIREQADRVIGQLSSRIDEMAGRYGSATSKEGAGIRLASGVRGAIDKFSERGGKLYGKVDEFVPQDASVNLANTKALLNEVPQEFAENQALGGLLDTPLFRQYRAALDTDGPITYDVLRKLRTRIGKEISKPAAFADEDRAAKEALYGALTQDMRDAAVQYGGDAGLAAWTRANTYWRNFRNYTDEVASKVLRRDSEPSKVVDDVLSGSRDGIRRLRRVKAGMNGDMWNDFVAYKIRDLGKATPGAQDAAGEVFSPSTFLTNWNKLDSRAKDIMFGTSDPLRTSLDRLVRVSAALKDSSAMRNYSGTAQTDFYIRMLTNPLSVPAMMAGVAGGGYLSTGDVGTAATLAAGSYIAPRMAAKLITSPKFVDWLSRGVRIADANPNRLTAHIGRLATIAGEDDELAEAANGYLRALTATLPDGGQTSQGTMPPPAQSQNIEATAPTTPR